MQLSREENHDDVFVVQEKPVETGAGDLMSWDDDSTDGRSVPEKDPPVAFRKRADSTEGETFPKPVKLAEIEAPITLTQKEKVQSAPVNILDLHDEVGDYFSVFLRMLHAPVVISLFSRVALDACNRRKLPLSLSEFTSHRRVLEIVTQMIKKNHQIATFLG